jgi:hypothetical protein
MSEPMSLLRTSPPPAQAVELEQWSLSSGTDLRPLRLALRAALSAHRLVGPAEPDEVPDRVILVATELASNALRHGSPPAVVRLLRGAGEFVVDVADHDLAGAPRLARVHQAGAGGRGLHIARTLTHDLCWYVTERTKHIWASFPLPPGGASRQPGTEPASR